ncbi:MULTISPECIES: MlaE family ABC transporter permease [Thermodesulfovibrio]|jgi:phospholipid/cholesterol/gamma-HCH transport system permease protein|uniref:Toluene tolerance protein Ttg2B n=2 Tax=Thermodesulfovibrio yellowstonii TaxID=28262 RepID=B5YGR9_THEYD|nr:MULTISPECIES: ABC transporter permease [Thermodesulfovibrio]ACI21026.1 toluene tolerance protein Ttg2B [Thermodesulfovibrio yellowstonii DSM 11347]MDI6864961.1 ABC transporter permease [Thermodesulfovibrio yellowstonii]GLI52977.1 toluene tolerance protein Ttg2B [Thermodesulfovibrio islandicus]
MKSTIQIQKIISDLQDFYILCVNSIIRLFRKPLYFDDIVEQMEYAGSSSVFIVSLVCLFVGMALSLQLSAELSGLGLKMYTGKIVGIAVIREIGPLVTALVFIGRVGAGQTAEIGSMILGHQIDTLRVYGIDPIKKVVVPRVVASVVMLPCLTIIGDLVCLFGGYYIAVFVSNQSGSFYWSSIIKELTFQNVLSGSIKPFIFGYLISCISCFYGLTTRGGAKGLRTSTTKAVVTSIVVVIAMDFVLTRILLYALGFSV